MALFCFDIDGTLFDNETRKISNSTIETIQNLKKNHKVAICTGRAYDSVKGIGILDVIEWDGVIVLNGQLVYDKNKQVIFANYLNFNSIKNLVDYCIAKGLNFSIATADDWYLIKEADPFVYESHQYFDEIIPHVKEYSNENVVMANLYVPKDFKMAELDFIKDVKFVPSPTTCIDICSAGCDKSIGINKLLEYLNEDGFIAFGDGSNDIEMLEAADFGIAMGNAKESLKEVADYVTKTCVEDGIRYACEKLNLFDGNCIEKLNK